ncbi:ficolin-1-B-like [Haliotis rufescens]|uniref:ficolin-1-B-like n=1 Tax=Haliotis rufescens TaxID=6454 RepID=UPI00201EDE90|nr:ficolin-1-B-like [Haliotis rufescens]
MTPTLISILQLEYCIETPQVIGELYLIQPLGSHSEFEWTCTSPTANYTEVSTIDTTFSLDYAITWQQIKLGVLMFQGFYILGAENMHKLTIQGRYDLMMVFIVTGKPFGQVYYKHFRVDSEAEGYACHWDLFQPDTTILPASYDYMDGLGGAGDPNKNLNGAGVGTYDKDINGCANANNAAWWYNPLGCTSLKFESNGIHWPTNRTGTVVLEPVYATIIGMKPVYWYVEDDLVL